MDYLEVTMTKDCVKIFNFLYKYPAKAYQKDEYFKLLYMHPLDSFLTSFSLSGIRVKVTDKPVLAGWKLVRDIEVRIATGELLEMIEELEICYLRKHQTVSYVEIKFYVVYLLTYGIRSRYDMQFFTKLLFCCGYDQETVIGIYSNITKNTRLSRDFITLQAKLYQTKKGTHEH